MCPSPLFPLHQHLLGFFNDNGVFYHFVAISSDIFHVLEYLCTIMTLQWVLLSCLCQTLKLMELTYEPSLCFDLTMTDIAGQRKNRASPHTWCHPTSFPLSKSSHCLRIQVQTVYSREVFERSSYRDKCLHLNI